MDQNKAEIDQKINQVINGLKESVCDEVKNHVEPSQQEVQQQILDHKHQMDILEELIRKLKEKRPVAFGHLSSADLNKRSPSQSANAEATEKSYFNEVMVPIFHRDAPGEIYKSTFEIASAL